MSYPEEWQKSRRILKERDEFLASAALRPIPSSPTLSSRRLPSPVSRRSFASRSSRPTTSATVLSSTSARRAAAEDYAEQVFTHLEENLKSLTSTVARCRQQLNEGANASNQNGNSCNLGAFRSGAHRARRHRESATAILLRAPLTLLIRWGEKEFALDDGISYDVVLTYTGDGVLVTGLVRALCHGRIATFTLNPHIDIAGEIPGVLSFRRARRSGCL